MHAMAPKTIMSGYQKFSHVLKKGTELHRSGGYEVTFHFSWILNNKHKWMLKKPLGDTIAYMKRRVFHRLTEKSD